MHRSTIRREAVNNVVTTLILTTFLVLSLGSFAQAQTPTFSITISAAKRVFASGSEIRLEIVQTNTSDQDIVVTRGIADAEAAAGGFRVEVQDAKGNPPPETKFQRILKGEEQPTEPIIGSGKCDIFRQEKSGRPR